MESDEWLALTAKVSGAPGAAKETVNEAGQSRELFVAWIKRQIGRVAYFALAFPEDEDLLLGHFAAPAARMVSTIFDSLSMLQISPVMKSCSRNFSISG